MSNINFAEKTSFSTVCNVLEKISEANRSQKENIMRQFISSFHEKKTHRNDNFYPILRMLLPHLEKERTYGLKCTNLKRVYKKILCLSDQSKDGQKLETYNQSVSGNSAGDLADTLYWILKSRFSEEGKSTVYEINNHLDNIATKHANRDPRGVEDELQSMILKTSPLEQKWLIRILLKNLRLSLSEKKVLAMFHPDANDLFEVSNNLQKVCSTLTDPSIRYNEICVKVFQPFKPMLSQQCDIELVEKDIIGSEEYYVEIKFDGERFQLHLQDNEFKYFSRNGYEYTDTYGCNSSNGILTPKIAKQLSSSVQSCILDGEMMCWNTRSKCYTTKGMNIDVKSLKMGLTNQPCFVVFDILYLNGQTLTNKPLTERLKILDGIIHPLEGVIVISAKDTVTSGTQILDRLKKAIENCEEGIVVKNPTSVYKFSSRNAGWYKIKPEYTEGMVVDLDVLIIGGYYGDGRRKGVISQFLLGIADSKKNENNEPIKFYSMGRVGSGYSDRELEELNLKLEKFWKPNKGNKKPPGVEWTKEKPDVWIKPSDSFILQVKATELVPSNHFHVGYTVRFPRVQKIRYDKPWYDCIDVEKFTSYRQARCGKLTAEYTAKIKNESSPKKVLKRNIKKPALDESSSTKKIRKDEMISDLFQNKEICVIPSDEFSKKDLEIRIMQHGGTVVQNPSNETFCVIANENNVRVANIIRQNRYDIVKSTWLRDCIEKKTLRKWRPDDLLFRTENTSKMILEEYDSFGDSYTEIIDLDRLEKLRNAVKVEANCFSSEEMQELDRKLFGRRNPFAIFRGCFAHFHDVYENLNQKYEAPILKAMFGFHGGIITSEIDHSTTHLITFSNGKMSDEFRRKVSSYKIKIVDYKWITESWEAKCLLKISNFKSNAL